MKKTILAFEQDPVHGVAVARFRVVETLVFHVNLVVACPKLASALSVLSLLRDSTNTVEGSSAVVEAVRTVPRDDGLGEHCQCERSHGDLHNGWMDEGDVWRDRCTRLGVRSNVCRQPVKVKR